MKNINWTDIIGHKNKISQIRSMINNRQFPHAVIFSGIDGIGKRQIADVTAAALLCENDDAPCGHCRSCRAFIAESHPDYYDLEPDKSKVNPIIKIGQIRELQSAVSLMPILSEQRIVLINDADLMNDAAQNCLLKTVEEPRGLSRFILITSNRNNLLLTLQSRCMIINFDCLTEKDIERGLTHNNIENAAEIAVISGGSLGHALNLAANNGLQIRSDAFDFLKSIPNISIEDIFIKSQQLSESTKEQFNDWINYLQHFLMDLLLIHVNITQHCYNRDMINQIYELNDTFADSNIYAMMHEAAEVQRRLRSNANLKLLIEAFFIRLRRCL